MLSPLLALTRDDSRIHKVVFKVLVLIIDIIFETYKVAIT